MRLSIVQRVVRCRACGVVLRLEEGFKGQPLLVVFRNQDGCAHVYQPSSAPAWKLLVQEREA